MSNTLTKQASETILTPAVPGDPGRPPAPARCVTTSTTTMAYPVYYVVSDGSGTVPKGVIQEIRGSSYPVTETKTVCYPADPGVPPTPYIPANISTQMNLGWNGGARSLEALVADGGAKFSVPVGVVGAVVGLNNGATDFSYGDADHALYFRRGLVSVIESGVAASGAIPYVTADVFRIERSGSTVRYYQNTTLIYTSAVPSYGVQFLESSLYSGGDEVLNASMDTTVTPGRGSGGAVLQPIAARGGIASSAGTAMLAPLRSSGTGYMEQGGRAVLAPLQAIGGRAYASGVAAFAPLSARGDAGLAPSFAIGSAILGYLGAQGVGRTGGSTVSPYNSLGDKTVAWPEHVWAGYTVYIVSGTGAGQNRLIADNNGQALRFNDLWVTPPNASSVYEIRDESGAVLARGTVTPAGGAMRPLVGLGSNYAYAGGTAALQPVSAFGAPLIPLNGYAFITAPAGTLFAAGHDSTGENAAHIVAPTPTLQAYLGSTAKLRAPAGKLSAQATGTNWLKAEIAAPAGVLSASATASGTSQADIIGPMATLVGYAGMVCSITLTGKATVAASVTSGSIMRAAITAPLFELTASASAENHCSADLLAPAGRLGATLQAWVMAPAGVLTAIGSAVVAATYEAYSINLAHRNPEANDEVTRYTNFPFDRIVRYQGSYFGVAADGLYLLDGTTDDGQAIPYAVKTCIDDFKQTEKKTLASAYFGGRLGPDATVTVFAGETGETSYDYCTPRGPGAQNHREKFGRGVKDRYFAIGLAGKGVLELDNIEPEINKLTRRI